MEMDVPVFAKLRLDIHAIDNLTFVVMNRLT